MTGMFRVAHGSFVFLMVVGVFSLNSAAAWQEAVGSGANLSDSRRALNPGSAEPSPARSSNEPVAFSISTMAGDLVPPFPAHPTLATDDAAASAAISFEENMPVKPQQDESIDDCCHELTEMIAGNLDTEISLDAKKRMIETALKMVARNVALKAEAKLTRLRAEHALEMARLHSQMGQMRSMGSAADQINRVAGPLSQLLQRNYQQTAAMNLGNQQLSQTLAQLGRRQLEKQAAVDRTERQRIELSTPPQRESDSQWQIAQLTRQVAQLQQQLAAQQGPAYGVQRATYRQPLQPRLQPLEPMSAQPREATGSGAGSRWQR